VTISRAALLLLCCGLAACAPPAPRYSGTVQTESIAVGSQLGGRVVATFIAAGSRVRRGEVLLQLDGAQLTAERDEAAAEAGQAAERLTELVNGSTPDDIARARALSAQAQAQYRQAVAQAPPQTAAAEDAVRDASAAADLTRVTLERMQALAATGDVARQSLDQARSADAQAQARLAQARADAAALVGATLPGERSGARAAAAAQQAAYRTVRDGARAEEIAQARAQVATAQAAERYAAARLREATVVAPADGVIESFNLHPGDLLAANAPAAIVDTFADPYAYIYASQSDLGALVRGRRVKVTSDAGGVTYDGIVEALDRNAQFTPQNTETADQRAELVYGVKVRIRDPRHTLLSGTTITASPA
jgi:multidrug resistance efflux pump